MTRLISRSRQTHGVRAAARRELRQVAAILVEQARVRVPRGIAQRALARLAAGLAVLRRAEKGQYLLIERLRLRPRAADEAVGRAVRRAQHAHQQMLRAHIARGPGGARPSPPARWPSGPSASGPGPARRGRRGRTPRPTSRVSRALSSPQPASTRAPRLPSSAATPSSRVLGAHIAVPQRRRRVPGGGDGPRGPLGESAATFHAHSSLLRAIMIACPGRECPRTQ